MEDLISQKYLLLNKASLLRDKSGGRSYPRHPEPQQKFTHHDYLLEEMRWLASDFIAERQHKRAEAFLLVKEASFSHRKKERDLHAKDLLGKSIGKKCAQMVRQFYQDAWSKEWALLDRTQTSLTLHKCFKSDRSLPIYNYARRIIQEFGIEVDKEVSSETAVSSPSTADSETFDISAVTSSLWYTVDDFNSCETEIKAITEQEVDFYAPPIDIDVFQQDVYFDENERERNAYELLPGCEEFAMFEETKKDDNTFETNTSLLKIQSGTYDFPGSQTSVPRYQRDWKYYEDMNLERAVSEFGGQWSLVSDIMSHLSIYTPEACKNRWNYLQMKKGRRFGNFYKPQPCFQSPFTPLQQIPSRITTHHKPNTKVELIAPSEPSFSEKPPGDTFDYYINNLYFDNCDYFYKYPQLSRFYINNEVRYNFINQEQSELKLATMLEIPATVDEQEIKEPKSALTMAESMPTMMVKKTKLTGKKPQHMKSNMGGPRMLVGDGSYNANNMRSTTIMQQRQPNSGRMGHNIQAGSQFDRSRSTKEEVESVSAVPN